MNRLQQSIAGVSACQKGSISILFALTFIPFIAAAGIAVDYGVAAYAKTSLQEAADAAVLSAANPQLPDASRSKTATTIFAANVQNNAYTTSAVASVSVNDDSVSLTTTVQVPTRLTRIIGVQHIAVTATSSAALGKSYSSAAAPCILALSKTADDAFYLNGITHFTASNCGVYTNSAATASIRSVGASEAAASLFCTVGGSNVNDTFFPLPVSGCSAVPDPLAGLVAPTSDACASGTKATVLKKGNHTLSPGTFCGGLELMAHAVVSFEPGVYVIKNGPLIFRSGSQSSGASLTYYLTGTDARMQINGGADVDLRAQSSGPLAGILAAQDAASNAGATSVIQGGGTVKAIGAFYFPTQTFEVGGNGNIGQLSSAWAIVADKVHLTGNGQVKIEASFATESLPVVVKLPSNTAARILN